MNNLPTQGQLKKQSHSKIVILAEKETKQIMNQTEYKIAKPHREKKNKNTGNEDWLQQYQDQGYTQNV